MNAASIDNARLARRRRRAIRGQPAAMRSGTFVFESGQGSVRVRVAGAGRRTIVFVPDPPNVIEHYDELFELFAPHCRVVCFEALGFGFSFPSGGFRHTLEEQVAVAGTLLRALDSGPYTLAFSCGSSYIGLRLAAEQPQLVDQLILMQAPSWSEERRWGRRIDRGGLVRTPVLGQALLAIAKRRIAAGWYRAALPDESAVERFLAPCQEAFDQGACYCLASGFQANFSRDLEFDPVMKPTLVVWGLRDRTHRRSDRRSILKYVPSAQLVEFKSAGHFPELEEPERFAQLALEWLGVCPSTP